MTNEVLLRRFLRHLRDERNMLELSIYRYRAWMPRYFMYLEEAGISVWDVTYDDASEFIGHVKRQGYSPPTVSHVLGCLRNFYNWAIQREYIIYNPFALIKPPRQNQGLPRYLTKQEMSAIMNTYNDVRPKDIRDRAILEFLYSTGCRVSEVCGLDLRDLDLEERRAYIRGKGAKERIVFLNDRCLKWLGKWLKGARKVYIQEKGDNLAVFLGRDGKRIAADRIRCSLQTAAQSAGIGKHVTPHMIRHSFATHLLEAGADIRYVQELLGHARLSTTQIYTHVAKRKLREVYDIYHHLEPGEVDRPTPRPWGGPRDKAHLGGIA